MKSYTALPYQLSDFDFDLPENLIAQMPTPTRTASRLLHVAADGSLDDGLFRDITDDFIAGEVLVLNNTKVIPARLHGNKLSGAKLEIFVERVLSDTEAVCMVRANRRLLCPCDIQLAGQPATVTGRQGLFFLVKLDTNNWQSLLAKHGDIPLPPYIHRQANDEDANRYQTVYAKQSGAVAAPTAGLHFDQVLLKKLADKGVNIVELTLHVGAGTFQPVKTENLDQHQMHFEQFFISDSARQTINTAKSEDRRITAVGTTSLRALESSADNGRLQMAAGDTDLFIRPGYPFQIVDRLLTNFHLPKSSLMMLISAFAGYQTIRHAYQHAIANEYRFFSYGDAMFLIYNPTDVSL